MDLVVNDHISSFEIRLDMVPVGTWFSFSRGGKKFVHRGSGVFSVAGKPYTGVPWHLAGETPVYVNVVLKGGSDGIDG